MEQEQHTEEINKLPTQEAIDKELIRFNKVRLLCDQAAKEFRQATENSDINPDEVSLTFQHKQSMEHQYMGLHDWLWKYTPHGIFFDHVDRKYILR